MMWLLLISCQSTVEFYQTIDLQDGDYAIQSRTIDTLTDPNTMQGTLGNMYVGGIFEMDLTTTSLSYNPGPPARPIFTVQDNTAIPLDRDGLIAFSFYAHLEDTLTFINQSDTDFAAITPVDVAISPILPDLTLALLPLENAAYVPSVHHFIVLSDLLEKEVPLAANKGVVAHEFGHAVFHYLSTGGTETERIVATDSLGRSSIASLDEGLADVLGYLISNNPDFIAASLPNQNRALDTLHLAEEVDVLPGEEPEEGILPSYDPYPLGSVFAATIWTINQTINDNILLFNWLTHSTEQFGLEIQNGIREDSIDLGFQWLDVLVDEAPSSTEQSIACEAIRTHFTTVYEVSACQ